MNHDYSCEYEVIKLGIRRLGDGGVRGRVANRGREDTTGGDGEEEPPLRFTFTAAILQMLFTEFSSELRFTCARSQTAAIALARGASSHAHV